MASLPVTVIESTNDRVKVYARGAEPPLLQILHDRPQEVYNQTRTLFTIVNRVLEESNEIKCGMAREGARLLGKQHLAIVDDTDRLPFQAVAIERRVFRFGTQHG